LAVVTGLRLFLVAVFLAETRRWPTKPHSFDAFLGRGFSFLSSHPRRGAVQLVRERHETGHERRPSAMVLRSIYFPRSLRVVGVLAVLCCLWVSLVSVRSVGLTGRAILPPTQRLDTGRTARIGKVTVAANTLDSPIIHRALQSHKRHNAKHGYPHFIAMNEAVSGLTENDYQDRPKGAWTKPAYLLSILVAEMQKPENERLDWILCVSFFTSTYLGRQALGLISPAAGLMLTRLS
jgi:hypothetical protein